MSSAEALARALDDMRHQRITNTDMRTEWARRLPQLIAEDAQMTDAVVDLTPVYREWVDTDKRDDVYGGLVMPVWQHAIVGYHNHHTSTTRVGVALCTPIADYDERWPQPDDHPFDWAEVTHVHSLMTMVWSPLSPRGRGPLMIFRIAASADGRILDIHWTDIAETERGDEPGMGPSMNLAWTLLRAYDLLACRNVDIVEPHRDRPTRRRIERAAPGARISELAIFPAGGWSRSRGTPRPISETGTPLHTVRGHFAEYGVNGKGLLFGRLSGRFFVPQHARGRAENGTVEHRYTIHDETA